MVRLFRRLVLFLPLYVTEATSDGSNFGSRRRRSHWTRDLSSELEDSRDILPRDVTRSVMAVRLAQLVNDGYKDDADNLAENYGFLPSDGIYLESGIDAVYLARVGDDYCSAAFRGTASFQVGDWFTNLYLGPVAFGASQNDSDDENGDSDDDDNSSDDNGAALGCDVHRGYHKAYAEFEYRDVVEGFLRDCRSECPGCETVLTGHSQGGGIAEVAALYLKQDAADNNKTTTTKTSPYVITFGAPQSLGAGCRSFFSEDEKRKWFRYVMATEGKMGKKLVYDPIPLLYAQLLDSPEEKDGNEHDSENGNGNGDDVFDNFDGFDVENKSLPTKQTYARQGGLAYIGHEILLSTEDPSAALVSEFDGHRFVDLSYIDFTGKAHYDNLYSEVLEAQDKIYNNNGYGEDSDDDCHEREDVDSGSDNPTNNNSSVECPGSFLPFHGFAVGTLCNPGESSTSTCAEGTVCEAEKEWWFWDSARHVCQPTQPQETDTSFLSTSTAAPYEVTIVENDDHREGETLVIPETSMAPRIDDLGGISGSHRTRAPALLAAWTGYLTVSAMIASVLF